MPPQMFGRPWDVTGSIVLRMANRYPGLRIDVDEARRYLIALDPRTESFIFCAGLDSKARQDELEAIAERNDTKAPRKWDHRFDKLRFARAWLEQRQQRLCGAFVAVQLMKGTRALKRDVECVRCIVADLDRLEPLVPWPLLPSMIVSSSPGKFHVYWLIAFADQNIANFMPELNGDDVLQQLALYRGILERIIETYGTDPGAKDVARRMRMPGSWWLKDGSPPHQARIVGGTFERYPLAKLLEAFPPIIRPKPAPRESRQPRRPGEPRIHDGGYIGASEYFEHFSDLAVGPLSVLKPDTREIRRLIGLAIHAERSDRAGFDLWDRWLQGSPNYDRFSSNIAQAWEGFVQGGGVTGGTVYALAKAAGWKASPSWIKPSDRDPGDGTWNERPPGEAF
jgi:hypothetical protein